MTATTSNQNKKTFLTYDKPLYTVMVQANNPTRTLELIEKSLPLGADAFGMQFCKFPKEHRNPETYKKLFEATGGKPVYVTNYRPVQNYGKSDEVLAEELLELASCGATLCDVMGNFFDPLNPYELTANPEAIAKQKELIDALHAKGAEVLMSSHIFAFTTCDEVLRIAHEHKARGADVCKIVVHSATIEQQIENLKIIDKLKQTLDIPFLFLSIGESKVLRRVADYLGNCMTLCVLEHDEISTKEQPLLADAKLFGRLLN